MTASLHVKNGIWQIIFSYKDDSGKWKQKSISTGLKEKGNKKRAQQLMAEKLREFECRSIQTIEAEQKLFLSAMWEWLCEIMPRKVRPNTLGEYKRAFQYNIETYEPFKNLPLRKLSPVILQKFYSYKLQSGLSANTILKLHANIHKFLKYAVSLDMIQGNPAERVTLPSKERSQDANFCTAPELQDIIQAFKGDPLEMVVFLTANLGLRRSEICGLRWDAVDFAHKCLYVQHTAIVCDGTVNYVDQTKSASSRRAMPLSDSVYEKLHQARDEQERWSKLMGNSYNYSGYVCTKEDGTPIHPNFVSRHFPCVLKAHGLPSIRFHDLRHSAASLLHANGYDMRDIQAYLGHSDIKTTSIYTHLTNSRLQEMADSVGNSLSNPD